MRKPKTIKILSAPLTWLSCVILLLISGCDSHSSAQQEQRYAKGAILAAQTSADGKITLVSSGLGPVQVWHAYARQPLYQWHQGQVSEPVLLLAIAPDSQYAATATERTVAIWSLVSGENQGFYELNHTLRTLAIADHGQRLVLGYDNGELEFIELSSGRRLVFMGHKATINSVDLSANGRYALSADQAGQVLLWDTQSAQVLSQWQHTGSVTLVRLDPSGKVAFSASSQGEAQLHQLPSGKRLGVLAVPKRGQTFVSARFDNEHQQLLTGSTARRLELWQLNSGQLLEQWQVGTHTKLRPASAMVFDVAFTDENQVFSVSSSGLWETWTITSRDKNDE